MSQFGPSYLGVPNVWGGSGFGGINWLTQPVYDQPSKGKPPTGPSPAVSQRVGFSTPSPFPWGASGGPFGAPDGGIGVGVGFGGGAGGRNWFGQFGLGSSWAGGQWPRGWVQTYRMMDFDATFARLKARYVSTIAPNPVVLTKNEAVGGTDDDVAFCKAVFPDAAMVKIKAACCESLSYGKAAFEKVWGKESSGKYRWYYDALDPQWPDGLQICKYKDGPAAGKFAGIIPFGQSMTTRLDERKSWVCNVNGNYDNLHGIAYHEAGYDPWTQDNAVSYDEWRLRSKVSNTIPTIKYPIGSSDVVLASGETQTVDNFQVARECIQAVENMGGIVLPNVSYEPQHVQRHPELAKLSLWQVDFYQAGALTPAIGGYISKHDSLDKRKCRAWLLSELANMEQTHGGLGQGDTKPHGDADADQIEFVDMWLTMQMQSLIDDLMVTNGRPAGCVLIKARPYFDEEQSSARETVNAAIASPVMAPNVQKVIDMDKLLAQGGFPTIKGQTWAALMASQADQDAETHSATIQQMKQPKTVGQGNQPPANGVKRLPPVKQDASEN